MNFKQKHIICDIKPAFQTNENDMRKMEPAIIMNQARNESIRKKSWLFLILYQ